MGVSWVRIVLFAGLMPLCSSCERAVLADSPQPEDPGSFPHAESRLPVAAKLRREELSGGPHRPTRDGDARAGATGFHCRVAEIPAPVGGTPPGPSLQRQGEEQPDCTARCRGTGCGPPQLATVRRRRDSPEGGVSLLTRTRSPHQVPLHERGLGRVFSPAAWRATGCARKPRLLALRQSDGARS